MNEIEAETDLRDRAIQLALAFAGRTISESDGTYNLLITVAQDAMREWARLRVEEERQACAKIVIEGVGQAEFDDPFDRPGELARRAVAKIRARGEKKNDD